MRGFEQTKRIADTIALLLDTPIDERGESLLHYFCRIHCLTPPRRSRAIYDIVVASGHAKNFPCAVDFVVRWLKDWPGVEIDIGTLVVD